MKEYTIEEHQVRTCKKCNNRTPYLICNCGRITNLLKARGLIR